jgi:hypothetical protein
LGGGRGGKQTAGAGWEVVWVLACARRRSDDSALQLAARRLKAEMVVEWSGAAGQGALPLVGCLWGFVSGTGRERERGGERGGNGEEDTRHGHTATHGVV